MPVPIIIYGGAALAMGAIGVLSRRRIARILFARTMLVLGQKEVGKTTLLRFVSNGEVTTTYSPTYPLASVSGATHVTSGEAKNSRNLHTKKGFDLSGEEAERWRWEEAFNIASDDPKGVCLYLVNAAAIRAGNSSQCDRVRRDAALIHGWEEGRMQPGRRSPALIVVGTHADKLEGYDAGGRRRGELNKWFSNSDELSELHRSTLHRGSFLAALNSKDGLTTTLNTVCNILTQYERRR